MRVSDARATPSVERRVKTRKATATNGFSVDETGALPAAGPAAPSQAITGIDALLSVQSIEDPLIGRRKALERGEEMLDLLERIKIDLLAGRVSRSRLQSLHDAVSARTPSDTPAIDDLLAEIELRARVELAKLENFSS